jgi:AhpD family alkylhydroperoxidase
MCISQRKDATMTCTHFTDHTLATAPERSRRLMTQTEQRLGYLPAAVARIAESPELLSGFLTVSGLFERASLDPLARETLILTIATRNECHVCVAMHTASLTRLGCDAGLIAALRDSKPLADERLEAIRVFTEAVLATAGAVGLDVLQAFLDNGYTRQNALEVVLGIGAYTTSTLANRMTAAPLDDALLPFEWTPGRAAARSLA